MSEELANATVTDAGHPPAEVEVFTAKLIAALKTVFDPEIPVDVYELGLIYKVDVADNWDVNVDMTLTAPGCPVAVELPVAVREALDWVRKSLAGTDDAAADAKKLKKILKTDLAVICRRQKCC